MTLSICEGCCVLFRPDFLPGTTFSKYPFHCPLDGHKVVLSFSILLNLSKASKNLGMMEANIILAGAATFVFDGLLLSLLGDVAIVIVVLAVGVGVSVAITAGVDTFVDISEYFSSFLFGPSIAALLLLLDCCTTGKEYSNLLSFSTFSPWFLSLFLVAEVGGASGPVVVVVLVVFVSALKSVDETRIIRVFLSSSFSWPSFLLSFFFAPLLPSCVLLELLRPIGAVGVGVVGDIFFVASVLPEVTIDVSGLSVCPATPARSLFVFSTGNGGWSLLLLSSPEAIILSDEGNNSCCVLLTLLSTTARAGKIGSVSISADATNVVSRSSSSSTAPITLTFRDGTGIVEGSKASFHLYRKGCDPSLCLFLLELFLLFLATTLNSALPVAEATGTGTQSPKTHRPRHDHSFVFSSCTKIPRNATVDIVFLLFRITI